MSEIRLVVSTTLLVITGCILLISAIGFVIERVTFQGALVRIEQLRSDAEKVRMESNEDVVGQVTRWNQAIRAKQRYNQMFFIGIIIPDGWDSIQPIEIPSR